MTVQSKRMCTTENFEYCTMDSTSGTSAGMSGASRPSDTVLWMQQAVLQQACQVPVDPASTVLWIYVNR